jgi:predicted SPOUT superfamily RNA methylase MTH1
MKKLVIASTLLALTTASSFAATTGTLLLQGVVAQKISLTVTSQAVASTLDLSTTQTDLNVASVNEKSNSKTGYKVTITSSNLSKLKRADGAEVVAYTMKYGGATVDLSLAAGATIANNAASSINVNKSVAISYTGATAESMVEGTYADTVTFTIAAN